MKKVLFALALLASVTFASAQNVKTENAAKAALEKAQAAANNAKQATKVATWLKLATSYMDAYNAPMGNGWIGAQAQELQLVMANGATIDVEFTLVKPTVTTYNANPVSAGAALQITGTDLDLVTEVKMGTKEQTFIPCEFTFIQEDGSITFAVSENAYSGIATLVSAAGYETTTSFINVTYDL